MELDLEAELAGALHNPGDTSSTQVGAPVLGAAGAITLRQAQAASTDHMYQKVDSSMTTSTDSAIVTSMTSSAMTFSSISTSDLNNSFTIGANMTGSTDSAIYSAPGSRSGTASPVFSQAVLRYAAANRNQSRLVAMLPSRPVSLPIAMHDFPHNTELKNGLTALSICQTTQLTDHCDQSVKRFSNYSLDSPLKFVNCDPQNLSLGSNQSFDNWMSEFSTACTGSSLSCDSGVVTQSMNQVHNSCDRCSRSLVHLPETADNIMILKETNSVHDASASVQDCSGVRTALGSYESSGCLADGGPCRPCAQCACVLNTVAAVQDMRGTLTVQPCETRDVHTSHALSVKRCYGRDQQMSDAMLKPGCVRPYKRDSICRDSGCDFTT